MQQFLLSQEKFFSNNVWGTYYLHKYYFTIQTHKTRSEAGLKEDKHELTPNEQRHLQWENYPAMLHEFLHYLHEVSTIMGHASMFNRIMMKSIFTKYAKPGMETSESLGRIAKPEYDNSFWCAWKTNEVLDGDGVLACKMHQIDDIDTIQEKVYFPKGNTLQEGSIDIPLISFTEKNILGDKHEQIKIGRFYLYESLAYELDHFVSHHLNHPSKKKRCRGTEYNVCRMIAEYIFKDIETQMFLAVALLALQNLNCGHSYIAMIKRMKENAKKGISQADSVAIFKKEVINMLRPHKNAFSDQQANYRDIFKGRTQLSVAFEYLTSVNIKLFAKRLDNPCFELDWIFEGSLDKLIETAQLCDFIYVFENDKSVTTNDPEFCRDYIGTTIDIDTSIALKTMIAFDHYFSAHNAMTTLLVEKKNNNSYCCPFYNCCTLPDRQEKSSICGSKPWRIYEIQYKRDKKYCWYSTGVLETKGLSTPTPI